MISEHVEEFAGKPVVEWDAKTGITDPEGKHYRITLDYDESKEGTEWTDKFAAFLDDPNAARVTGLVVGGWADDMFNEESTPIMEAIVAARDRLPNLKALFIGDITYEECEISWIQQQDQTPVLDAYPQLEHFRVRGGDGLAFGKLRNDHLQSLIIETGGLNGAVVRAVCAAQFPELTHLELWLGTDNYGGTTTLDDLQPLLAGSLFPKLTYLGLRDSEIADE